jgi:hypothetical protein
MFDWMSPDWQARGAETAILLPAGSKVHTWSFRYEPEARADSTWHDEALRRHVTDRTGNGRTYEFQGEEHLFERLKREEPKLTREGLHQRLIQARYKGLVEYFQRHNQHRWWKRPDAGKGDGRVTLRFDEERPYVIWFDEEIRRAPAEFDRFGLFNIARFGTRVELYLGDLTVNGQRFDLSQDPRCEGRNNKSRYTDPNFHAMHSYGWSQTKWAVERPGEIGGLFGRTEPQDPLCSYYGDDVGKPTLEDTISFSEMVCFTDGTTDAAAFFGYFNRENQIQKLDATRADAFYPAAISMGVTIADRSAVGYCLAPQVTSSDRDAVRKLCEVFLLDGRRRRFTLDYDPKGNGGTGRVTVTLDGRSYVLELTREQRNIGAVFNRFGLANVRGGGNSVESHLDDVTYTARRKPGTRPRFIPQETVEVPYPHKQAGQRY